MARPNRGPRLEINKTTGLYEIRYTVAGRSKRKQTGCKTEGEARTKLAAFLLKHETTTKTTPYTVAEARELRVVEKLAYCEQTTQNATRSCWGRIKPHFGRLLVTQVDQHHMDRFVSLRRRQGIADSTIRAEQIELVTCINHLVQTHRIAATDLKPLKILPVGAPRDRWLTTEETERLLQVAAANRKPKHRLSRAERFLWVAITTGARRRAIIELTWAQIDWTTELIHFNPHGRRQTTKTRPTVPIPTRLKPVLQRAYEERISDHLLDRPTDLHNNLTLLFEKAGLPEISPHILRHTYATQAIMAGVEPIVVARILGNSLKMVDKVYAKYRPDALRHGVDFVPISLSSVPATNGRERGAM